MKFVGGIKNLFSWLDKVVIYIFLITLLLRLVGILHSFPIITHPDEPTIVRSALGVRFFLNPKHFDWPHFYIYFNFGFYMLFVYLRNFVEILGLKGFLSAVLPLVWDDHLIFYVITRFFSAIFGALTVFPVYYAAKGAFGKHVALYSALVMALVPYHIWHSQYSLPDAPMVFFMSMGIYFSIRVLSNPSLRNYIWAGIFFGLSVSTKYNGALGISILLLAHVAANWKNFNFIKPQHKSFRNLVLAGVFTVMFFFIGTPFALFDFKTFTISGDPRGALWQFTNVGSSPAAEHVPYFFQAFFGKIQRDLSWSFVLAYLVMCGLSFYFTFKHLRNKKRGRRLDFLLKHHAHNTAQTEGKILLRLLLFTIPSLLLFYYIARLDKSRSHYYMIIYPLLSVVIGYFISFMRFYLEANGKKLLGLILVLVMFLFPLHMIYQNTIARWRNFSPQYINVIQGLKDYSR